MARYYSEVLGTYIEAEPIPFTGLGAERTLLDWHNPEALHPRRPAPPLRPSVPSVMKQWRDADPTRCAICQRPLMPWLIKTGTRRCRVCRGVKK